MGCCNAGWLSFHTLCLKRNCASSSLTIQLQIGRRGEARWVRSLVGIRTGWCHLKIQWLSLVKVIVRYNGEIWWGHQETQACWGFANTLFYSNNTTLEKISNNPLSFVTVVFATFCSQLALKQRITWPPRPEPFPRECEGTRWCLRERRGLRAPIQ